MRGILPCGRDAPKRVLVKQDGTDPSEAKVLRAHAPPQGSCENFRCALNLLAICRDNQEAVNIGDLERYMEVNKVVTPSLTEEIFPNASVETMDGGHHLWTKTDKQSARCLPTRMGCATAARGLGGSVRTCLNVRSDTGFVLLLPQTAQH